MVYFLVGITFGAFALLIDSILPVIPVHIAADLVFFIFVWPHDATRDLIWHAGTHGWFWVHIVQSVVFTVLFILGTPPVVRPAFRQQSL
jgi:hypothetical protein